MKKWLVRMALIVLIATGCAYSQDAQKTPPASGTTAKPAPEAKSASGEEYRIGPQDLVRIDVWKEPDISRTIPVRPDGKISLPLMNDVQAAGLTAMELAGSIREGLSKYITSPQVTVTVTEINSRRVYVTGEVMRPGAQPLLPNMTALQALTSAGGFTQFARTKSIYILRNEDGKQVKHPFNYKAVLDGKHPEDNIQLQPGDVIVVP